MHNKNRLILLSIILLLGISLLFILLNRAASSDLAKFCSNDFTQYYSAARLLTQGANPYDPAQLLIQERALGWLETEPIMMWNPPWTIILALPLLLFPFGQAAWIWLTINLALMMLCGAALWRVFSPGDQRCWLGMSIVILYMPTLQALSLGQISPWLLVGVTSFLVAVQAKRDGLAGASLIILTIKPHMGFLLILAVIWWAIQKQRWRILAGASMTLIVTCMVVTLFSRGILLAYLHAAISLPLNLHTSTIGTWFYLIFNLESRWLQFLPSVVGCVLGLIWMVRLKHTWNWLKLVPGLLLVSSICSAYGWPFDQVILLPILVAMYAPLKTMRSIQRIILMSLHALIQILTLLMYFYGTDSLYFYSFVLMLTGLYLLQQLMIRVNKSEILHDVLIYVATPNTTT